MDEVDLQYLGSQFGFFSFLVDMLWGILGYTDAVAMYSRMNGDQVRDVFEWVCALTG